MTSTVSLFERNKRLYLEEESKLQAIVCDTKFQQTFQLWLDQCISQLDHQYERCEQQLSELQQHVAVQKGSFWNSKTIIEHCNLHMAEKRLVRKQKDLDGDQHAQLPDLIQLVSTLQQTKSHSFITPKQRRFIEECEEELRSVVFEPRDLTFIRNALQTKLIDDGNTRGVFGDLTSFQNTIEELSPDIDQCEQLLEASIANGEMSLAEDISKRQIDIFEHILRLITDQYPIIANYYSESRNSDRRRRWAVFRMADRDITAVIESKHRQIEACEEDLVKLREQMGNYSKDDFQQRRRYDADCEESDRFLQENKEKQQSVWNRIFALFQELQTCSSDLSTLAQQRRKEIDRRLQMEEREAGRRSGHDSFLQASAEHAQKLQDTIDNASHARDVAAALNNFVLDGCDSITAKYDKQQNALSDMLRLVQQHHFKRFSDYYIATSRFLYRKERRLAQLEEEMTSNDMRRELMTDTLNPSAKGFAESNETLSLRRREVMEEVIHLRHKLEKAEKAVTPTLRSLDFAGIAYVHPSDIVEKMNLCRWGTILQYRSMLNPQHDAEALRDEADAIEQMRTKMRTEQHSTLRGQRSQRSVVSSTQPTVSGISTNRAPIRLAERVQAVFLRELNADSKRQLQQKKASRATGSAAGVPNDNRGLAATAPTAGSVNAIPGRMSNVNAVTTSSSSHLQPSTSPDAVPLLSANTTNSTAAAAAAAAASPFVPTHMEGATFQAIFSYKARAPDELSFEAGQQIVCISRALEEGWFRGVCNQRTGLFPINYVEPVREDDPRFYETV